MTDYKLSASLSGHSDDVRGVSFSSPTSVFSASRDGTVRRWKLLSSPPPTFDDTISSHGTTFVNAVLHLPPSATYTEGLVVSGGKDTIIEVREPHKKPEENAERLLIGHALDICALDANVPGGWIVSGSWDSTARVWNMAKWDCQAVLEGHQGTVWAVLAFNQETIITAGADKLIRVYTPTGKLLQTIRGNTEVVRALCKVLPGHRSGGEFASASNDGVIRLWSLQGRQVGELHGHESFIYSLASLPNGDIASAGEDRTIRVWRGQECIQTITHPAISVWSVAVCPENGDIASGASDRIVRVFSRDQERYADSQVIQAFEEAVRSSSIPQQQVGDVNKEKLPGPEFLSVRSGTKEGQVQMIREDDGSVTAHTWSQGAGSWVNVGTVIDAAGSSGKKKDYRGKEYDYVFDVDIEDGKPPLKLPYNLSQNPYEAATKFIQDNELPMTYLDEVTNFITTNTAGATIGQSEATQNASDPWGTGSRYRPGDAAAIVSQSPPQSSSRPKMLPQTRYLSIATANIPTILKKLEELNSKLSTEGYPDAALSTDQLSILSALGKHLQQPPSAAAVATDGVRNGTSILMQIITTWPASHILPALDLLRLLTSATSAAAAYTSPTSENLIIALSKAGVYADLDRPNNAMLAIRALANLFETTEGRALADAHFLDITTEVKQAASGAGNRNLSVAIATLYINYAVLCTSLTHKQLPSSIDRGLTLLEPLIDMVTTEKDSEVVYRALVAVGTWLKVGEEVVLAAKEIYGIEKALATAEARLKEPRVKAVVEEIRKIVKST